MAKGLVENSGLFWNWSDFRVGERIRSSAQEH